jgi:hypothetical protein
MTWTSGAVIKIIHETGITFRRFLDSALVGLCYSEVRCPDVRLKKISLETIEAVQFRAWQSIDLIERSMWERLSHPPSIVCFNYGMRRYGPPNQTDKPNRELQRIFSRI